MISRTSCQNSVSINRMICRISSHVIVCSNCHKLIFEGRGYRGPRTISEKKMTECLNKLCLHFWPRMELDGRSIFPYDQFILKEYWVIDMEVRHAKTIMLTLQSYSWSKCKPHNLRRSVHRAPLIAYRLRKYFLSLRQSGYLSDMSEP
jgi:hypothetical protein